jgi:hypothetical protein
MLDETVIIAISTLLGALFGIIPGTYAIYAQRREKKAASQKAEIEARKLADEIMEMVLERAKEEIATLTERNTMLKMQLASMEQKYDLEIAALTRRVVRLTKGVRLLCTQIQELGHEPVFNLECENEGYTED